MRTVSITSFAIVALVGSLILAGAQPPPPPPRDGGNRGAAGDVNSFVTRMLTLDVNKDGKLAREEITDSRLKSLFQRADADQDGTVTKKELTAFHAKESASLGAARNLGGRGEPGGPGGPGRPGPPPRGGPPPRQ